MMSLISVIATYQCEGCGQHIRITLDNDDSTGKDGCLMDLALDRLKLHAYDGDADADPDLRIHSYVGETVLCSRCTYSIDRARRIDPETEKLPRHRLSRTWILRQLGALG